MKRTEKVVLRVNVYHRYMEFNVDLILCEFKVLKLTISSNLKNDKVNIL